MRPPMRNELSVLALSDADVETANGQANRGFSQRIDARSGQSFRRANVSFARRSRWRRTRCMANIQKSFPKENSICLSEGASWKNNSRWSQV
jgi:hypothetical protein